MARQRATALEQQVYTLRARCVRLATWAIESGALDPGSLMPGDLATEYPELPAQGEGGG